MQELDSLIHNFRRRVAFSVALSRGLLYLAWGCFAWGGVALVLRAGFDGSRPDLMWGGFGLAPMVTLALIYGFRARPSRHSVRALLDRHNRSGGLVMAEGETDLGDWRPRVGPVQVPRLRTPMPWGLLIGGVVFAVAAFLVPVKTPGLEASKPLEIGKEVEQLAERIAVLKEEGLLDEAKADRFDTELRSLEEAAHGEDPASTWETLDHLQEMTDRATAEVAEAALAEGEQLAAAEAVAEALQEAGSEAEAGRLAEAMSELSALTARTAAESRLLDGDLARELTAGATSPGDLGRLLEALQEGQGSLSETLERLYAGGLIDLETLLQGQGALQGDQESLAEFLAENGLEAASGFCRGGRRGHRPGSGGISRGRDDAPMHWREPISVEGVRFREQVLDPASLAALRESHLSGLSIADPTSLDAAQETSAVSVIDTAAAGGGAAHTHTLLPRHRGAVRRYFDRPASGSQ